MIISGGSRSDAKYWARHLTRADENERVHIAEIKGLASETVPDALREMSELAAYTRATKFLYHADINPREGERLTDKQWDRAVDTLERNLGLEDHPRVVVEHEKLGRVHRHVVWSRIDPDKLTVVSDYRDWLGHQKTSRELEQAFALEPVTGVIGLDGKRRPRRPKNYETKRGRETGITPEHVAAELTALWKQADNGHAFAAAIADRGYILARGDRGYVVIDQAGTTHSLARRIEGARKADITTRLADVDLAALPSVEEARQLAKERAAQRADQERQPEPAPQPAPDKAEQAVDRFADFLREAIREHAESAEALPARVDHEPRGAADADLAAPPSAPEHGKAQQQAVDRFAELVREAVHDRDAHPAPEPLEAVPRPPAEPLAEALASRDLTAAEEAAPELLPELAAFELLTLALKRGMGTPRRSEAEAVRGPPARAGLPPHAIPPPAPDAFVRLSGALTQEMHRSAVKPFTGDGLTVWERTATIIRVAAERTTALVREAGQFVGRLLREGRRADQGDRGRDR